MDEKDQNELREKLAKYQRFEMSITDTRIREVLGQLIADIEERLQNLDRVRKGE